MAALRAAYGLPTCQEVELARLEAVTLGWFAIFAWGLSPDRHAILDYAAEPCRYIEESAAWSASSTLRATGGPNVAGEGALSYDRRWYCTDHLARRIAVRTVRKTSDANTGGIDAAKACVPAGDPSGCAAGTSTRNSSSGLT